MKFKKPTVSNIVFIAIITLLIWPKTRQPIQVFLHKGLAMLSPSEVDEEKRESLSDYNWKLQSLDGLDYDFREAEGKVIFINFWATWCPPCIAEMPAIQALYNDYEGKVEFLLVSEEEEAIIQKFLYKHDYTFKIFRPLSNIPQSIQTRSIPRTLLISKKGHIVIDKTGAANWNSESVRETLDTLIIE